MMKFIVFNLKTSIFLYSDDFLRLFIEYLEFYLDLLKVDNNNVHYVIEIYTYINKYEHINNNNNSNSTMNLLFHLLIQMYKNS